MILGINTINNSFLGNNTIDSIYIGNNLIWSNIDPDALAFFTELESQSVILTDTQKSAINLLCRNLKNNNIWNKLNVIYPIIGGTAIAHRYNLKNPQNDNIANRLTFFGSPLHSVNGISFNGTTQYANTHFTYSNANDTHMSFYTPTLVSNNDATTDMGHRNGTTNFVGLNIKRPNNRRFFVAGAYTSQGQYANDNNYTSNANGLTVGVRNSGNIGGIRLFRNGNLDITNTETNPTNTTVNVPLFIGARNDDGTAAAFSQRICSFVTMGLALSDSEVSTLYNIVQTYQTTLGRAI